MKKVIPTKSTERELVKFWKAVDELECQPDNHRFDHILSSMLKTPTHPSGGVNETVTQQSKLKDGSQLGGKSKARE